MIHNLRAIFQRQQLTQQEIRTFRGIITCLDGKTHRPKKRITDEGEV
jgi:tRNA/rRNA methyltransferase